MQEPNLKLMEVMRLEAKACFERGDIEDGRQLCETIFKNLIPHLIEQSKNDPYFIRTLIRMSNSKDEAQAFQALMILKVLKDNGVM